MKVYISGPISGYDLNERQDTFNRIAVHLRERGHTCFNPITNRVPGWGWNDYMRYDIKRLVECEAIYMLKGWVDSKGASIEHDLADKLGLTMYYE